MLLAGAVAAGHAAETPPTITSDGGGPTATKNVITGATAVTTVVATGTTVITYSISGGADAALFQIDPATGVLSFKAASTTGSKAVMVKAQNAFGNDTQAITVAVGVVPVITSDGGGPTAAIPVTAPATAVTTVVATGTAPIAYTITGGADQALFTLDSGTGVLAFAAPSSAGTYHVTVTATNTWGHVDQAITVTVS